MTASQINPSPIVAGHLNAMRDTNGHLPARVVLEQYVFPATAGAIAILFSMRISSTTGIAVLTLGGVFAAFCFQLSIQLLDRAAGWAETGPEPGDPTGRYADVLRRLAANAAYASLVSFGAAGSALCSSISSSGWQERWLAGGTTALLAHMVVTLLVVLRRVYVATVSRVDAASTGSSRTSWRP